MGEKQNQQPFQLLFNTSLKVDFQGSRVTSNGGLILVRELDERLGLEKLIEEHLSDSRQGLNKQFTLADLLRQSVYSRLAGYEDLNDAERLAVGPAFRLISSQRIRDRGAALTSTLHWFETELLTKEENLTRISAWPCLVFPDRFSSQRLSSQCRVCNPNSIRVRVESRCFLFQASTKGGTTSAGPLIVSQQILNYAVPRKALQHALPSLFAHRSSKRAILQDAEKSLS